MGYVAVFDHFVRGAFHFVCHHNWYCVWAYCFQDHLGSLGQGRVPHVHGYAASIDRWRYYN